MRPRFFKTQTDFRRWLSKNHSRTAELWVGLHKKASRRPSITYPEALDEALCVGWIDGVRRSVDQNSYTIRFTPRRDTSIWSLVNIRKVEALIKTRRMKKPGLDAYAKKSAKRQARYAYENKTKKLASPYERQFRARKRAWTFFQAQAPWYRRAAACWVMNAVREETRERRLATLIADSARGVRLAQLASRRVDTA